MSLPQANSAPAGVHRCGPCRLPHSSFAEFRSSHRKHSPVPNNGSLLPLTASSHGQRPEGTVRRSQSPALLMRRSPLTLLSVFRHACSVQGRAVPATGLPRQVREHRPCSRPHRRRRGRRSQARRPAGKSSSFSLCCLHCLSLLTAEQGCSQNSN
jgi:hypothetical protein